MHARAHSPLSIAGCLRTAARGLDSLPVWSQINITQKCNLACAYCTEYDNRQGHVPTAEVMARVDKCRELGVLHVDLIGGEPLLHPDLVSLMRHVRTRGMTTGMTTNGFLLTADKLEELIDSGMGRLQISVDGVAPKPGAPKSLKTLRSRIEMVVRRGLWFYVAAVLCEETLDEAESLAELCFDLGVPVFFSVVHHHGRIQLGRAQPRYLAKLSWLREQKRQGRPVANPHYLLEYYERLLRGERLAWRCQGGHKAFYVSPAGDFHYCYHTDAVAKLADMSRADLRRNRGSKGCEDGCGVDCMVRTSLPFCRRGWLIGTEIREGLRRVPHWVGLRAGRRTNGSSDSSTPSTPSPR